MSKLQEGDSCRWAKKDLLVDCCHAISTIQKVSPPPPKFSLRHFCCILSGFEKSLNLAMPDAKDSVANASTNVCNLNHPPSFITEKEKKAEGILCSDFSILMSYFFWLLITLFVFFQVMSLTLDGS